MLPLLLKDGLLVATISLSLVYLLVVLLQAGMKWNRHHFALVSHQRPVE